MTSILNKSTSVVFYANDKLFIVDSHDHHGIPEFGSKEFSSRAEKSPESRPEPKIAWDRIHVIQLFSF
jgi:hypothetical protein